MLACRAANARGRLVPCVRHRGPWRRFNKIDGFPLEMAPLFAHPNEGKLRMAVAGNPLLHVEAAAGMWTGGVWRPVDVHMPDAQVVQYILEQATMRVIAEKVWYSEGPFVFPRDFARVRGPAPALPPPPPSYSAVHCCCASVCDALHTMQADSVKGRAWSRNLRHSRSPQAIQRYFGGNWHDGLEGIAHTLHSYYRVRHDVSLPDPNADRVNDAERAEAAW